VTLTVAAIKAAQPGDVLRDTAVPGLQLRAFAGRKSFYLYYRTQGGEQRKPKIGDFPALTIDQARTKAKQWLAAAHTGADPSKARHDYRHAKTMADLHQQYMELHAPKKKSYRDDKRMWEMMIIPHFGQKKRVEDVQMDDIERFMKAFKRIPVRANVAVMMLSKAFNLAIKWRWRKDNPVRGISLNPVGKRERYLSPDEYKRLSSAMDQMADVAPHAVAALRVIAMTGARRNEIMKAKRDWLDGNILRLPDSKTGKKEIYIPDAALKIIQSVPPRNGWLMGTHAQPWRTWQKILTIAGITDLRIHDLRHSFASEALSAGYSLSQIGGLLGHKRAQTTMRYAHLQNDKRNEAATKIADQVLSRMI
jgi:integrase